MTVSKSVVKSNKMNKSNKSKKNEKEINEKDVDSTVKPRKKQSFKSEFEGNKRNSPLKRKASTSDEKPDWKKLKLEKKELKLKRKQTDIANNDVYQLSVNAKQIWEELRRDDCKRKEQLCADLYALIEGKAKSIIYAHDTVRVIETLIAVGGETYRSKLFVELKDELVELSKNKYSRFFVTKLLKYGTKDQRNILIKSFYGHVIELMKHKIACEVVELAYNDYANAQQRSNLMQEFYGPKFRLFKDKDVHSLKEALEKNVDRKHHILADVSRNLQPIIDKGVFTNTMIHTLLKEYLSCCSEEARSSLLSNIKEGLLPILHTRDGSRVAMMSLWYGSTKDRKVIIKALKGNFLKIANEEHGYMVLLAAFDCIDDTVFLSKAVLGELMENIDQLITTDSGKKVLTYLVVPRNKLFFHPDIINILSQGDGNSYTKKPIEKIHNELQTFVSEAVLKLIASNIDSWVKDSHWTLFVGAALKTFFSETVNSVYEKLAVICSDPYMPDEKESHFLDLSHSSKLITYVIQCDGERFKEEKPIFSKVLVEVAESELPGWILTNRSCFLLVKLIETEIPEVVEKILELLKSSNDKLKKLSFAGAKILLKKLKIKK